MTALYRIGVGYKTVSVDKRGIIIFDYRFRPTLLDVLPRVKKKARGLTRAFSR